MLLHGFMDTWHVWELVLSMLERRHDVLALTLAGHAGGPPLPSPITERTLANVVERRMDEAGFGDAHLAGNSLGGHVALQLAARGRARSVVALAPAGGWDENDPQRAEVLDVQRELHVQAKAIAPHADAILAASRGRRRATRMITVRYEHIPVELLARQLLAVAAAPGAGALLDYAATATWALDAERIGCPVRVVWGAADRLLPWPAAAVRYRREWLPRADWVELEDVGHCPQLDVPLETAQLILGLTAP